MRSKDRKLHRAAMRWGRATLKRRLRGKKSEGNHPPRELRRSW